MSNNADSSLAYPLAWKPQWPRTKPEQRRDRLFRTNGRYVSLHEAQRRLTDQVYLMPGRIKNLVLSTNLSVRKTDGMPKSNQQRPDDPGAVIYFVQVVKGEKRERALPCDKFDRVEQNVAALAGAIEALRKLDRYGTGFTDAAFRGFEALPLLPPLPWHEVLGVAEDATLQQAHDKYRKLASRHHPDNCEEGKATSRWQEINEAWQRAKAEARDEHGE